MRSLGKHRLSFGEGAVDFCLGVREFEAAHVFHALHPQFFFFRDVVIRIMQVAENLFVTRFERTVFLFKVLFDVADTQAHAGGLVAVSRTDALARGAYLVLALGGLVGAVEHAVGRQNEMGAAADVEARGDVVAGGFEFAGFCHEEVGRDDAAVAYDVRFAFIEDARRNGAQHEFLSVEDNGVAGVGASGKAGDYVVARREEIHDLAFAFVAENNAQQGINFSLCHILVVLIIIFLRGF